MAIPKLRLITRDKESTVNCQPLAMRVHVPDGRHVGTGAIVTTQSAANSLPLTTARRRSKLSKQHFPNLRLVSNYPEKETTANLMIAL